MCGEDGAQREVYKLKEEPGKGDRTKKREKRRLRNREKRERRQEEGRVVLFTKEKHS